MKKIVSLSLLFAVIIAVSTGCLKDKGFDNHEYGINSPETSPLGVGLPLATSPQIVGIELTGTSQTVGDMLVANFLSGNPAPADIKVNLVLNPTLVADYNTANSTNVVALPTSVYTLATSTITIKAGQNLGKIAITLPNTLSLNATITYGLGFSIASVDPSNYVIANNLKNLVLIFNVKNKYDGIYQLRGYHNRTSPDYTLPYNVKVQMITSGPSSVVMWYPSPGPDDYAHPINGSTGAYYGTLSPDVTFDPTTNNAVSIKNWAPFGATPPMDFITGTGISNKCTFNSTTGKPDKMYLLWRYNANDLRRFYDTLTYIGPR